MTRIAQLARESLALAIGTDSAYFITFALSTAASVLMGARIGTSKSRRASRP